MKTSKDEADLERERTEMEALDVKFKNFVSKQEQTLRVSIYLLLNLSEDIKVEEKMKKKRIIYLLCSTLNRKNTELLILVVSFLKKMSCYAENKDEMKMLNLGARGDKFMVLAQGDLRTKEKVAKASVIVPKFGCQKTEDDDKRNSLYNILIKLRLELGQTKGVAPYMVVTEQTLLQLAQMRPTSTANLAKIVGFNNAKIKTFGEAFIGSIVKFCVEENIDTDKFVVDEEGLDVNETTMTTYNLYKSGMTAEQIASERGLAASTITGHLAACLEKGAQLELCKLGVTCRMIADVASVLNEPPINSDVSKLGPIKVNNFIVIMLNLLSHFLVFRRN